MNIATALGASLLAAAMPMAAAQAQASAATAKTRYVEVNGDRIGYRSIGTGAPIIVANRMRGTLDTWDPLFLDALAERHTVITFDYPGIGYSGGTLPDDIGKVASFVADFATALGIDRFAMMGWSWGGATTQAVLLDQPRRVSHAIILAANPPGPVERPIQQAFIERALKPVNDADDDVVLFFEPKSEASRRAAQASRDRIYARPGVAEKIPSTPEQIQVYLKAAAAFTEDKAGRRAALATTNTPILIVAGDNDISTAGQNWFPLVGRIPNAQFLVYPGSGHGPQHQYPELTARYVTAFLAMTPKEH